MTDRYENDRIALKGYAKDVGQEAPHWNTSAQKIKSANVDWQAFTSHGDKIAANYSKLVHDYSWYAWRIGVTISRVESALNETANNYGKAESKVKDDINRVGEQL